MLNALLVPPNLTGVETDPVNVKLLTGVYLALNFGVNSKPVATSDLLPYTKALASNSGETINLLVTL